jgi:hypothetical protein
MTTVLIKLDNKNQQIYSIKMDTYFRCEKENGYIVLFGDTLLVFFTAKSATKLFFRER